MARDGLNGASEPMLQARHYICDGEGSRAAEVEAEPGTLLHGSAAGRSQPSHPFFGCLILDLAAPDHSTISRRGETLPVSRPRAGSEAVHLLVDSTGLKLCGPGEWLVEKHAAKVGRCWRKLHIGVDADTGEIIAAELTGKDVDDGSQVGPLLDPVYRRWRIRSGRFLP